MGTKIKKLLRKIQIKRTTLLTLAFILMGGILIRQIFDLQIIQGEDYISDFESRTTKTRVLNSTRGNIYDCNGVLLAWNELSYSVTFEDNGSYDTTREKNLTLNGICYRVIQILSENGDSLDYDSFHIVVDESGEYAFDISEGFTLNRFRADIYGYSLIGDMEEEEAGATAEEMMDFLTGSEGFSIVLTGDSAYTSEELAAYGLPEEFTAQELLDIAIMRYELNTNSYKKYMAVTVATGVSEESVAAIRENEDSLQGIEIEEDSVRVYIDDLSMGPILGYTGQASSEELTTLRESNPDYSNDAIVGKAGIEQYMELDLQGTDGEETVYVDNLGKVLRIDEDSTVEPVAGNDVYLTIDSDWQSAIYQILKQRVAGILLSKITTAKSIDYSAIEDASELTIPIYDVYYALIDNSVLDISAFADEDASDTEKNIYAKFQQKQQEVFDILNNRLDGSSALSLGEETDEIQEYLTYISGTLLTSTLGILDSSAIDTSDETYQAWTEGTISLREYLLYAASQNWIDISAFAPDGDYLDSTEVYSALIDYILDYLGTDSAFSKLLYYYLLQDDVVSGQELCLALYDQGVLSAEDDSDYEGLKAGTMTAYDFMIQKIYKLEIEPAQLALEPCSASCVIVDTDTGGVLACVSYPGYDSNRLANDMDTDYYASLALDSSSPFYNKATQQVTAPGSTLKILSTIAGMEEGVLDGDSTYIECTGEFELVTPSISCTSIHGTLGVREAIQNSCNYFFNMTGWWLGLDEDGNFSESQSLGILQKYASMIGLDQKTGIELSEATPQVSDENAVPSYIGQGTNLYSTSHLARYAAAIATSGTVYNLTLLDRVEDSEGTLLEEYGSEILNEMDVSSETWDVIHDGMELVVQSHEQFTGLGVSIAGKTGTAEISTNHPDHGLFISYAPTDDPQYAMAVRIENGYTSGNACLAANDIYEYIFELEDADTILTGYAAGDTSDTSDD
ncbi:MAG: peptidase [Clostridiales bacterium]|nr:peptidase [Clostridiales bacterium]